MSRWFVVDKLWNQAPSNHYCFGIPILQVCDDLHPSGISIAWGITSLCVNFTLSFKKVACVAGCRAQRW